MTAFHLQQVLKEELGKLLKDIRTTNLNGDAKFGVNIYEQRLPIIAEDDDDVSQFFPYCIVRLIDGITEDDDSPWTVTVDLIFGICEMDRQANGHRHIMTMIERTVDRFLAEPLLDGKYRAMPDMEWTVQESSDDDTYPYFFGGVEMKFLVPKMGRREPDYERFC